jgi:hypothetical protein
MWNLCGIEPEIIDYKTMRIIAGAYHLRPEIVESTYYFYHYVVTKRNFAVSRVLMASPPGI